MLKTLLVVGAVTIAGSAAAQGGGWSFSGSAAAPATLLDFKSATLPDSNSGHVKLGLGLGVEGGRRWTPAPKVTVTAFGRLLSAPVNSTVGGATWSPGRAFVVDVGGRAARQVSDRVYLSAGAVLSHWSGPDTSPLAGASSMLFGAEGALSVRPGDGPWYVDFTANFTRFSADDSREIATGFVRRWMIGLRRDR